MPIQRRFVAGIVLAGNVTLAAAQADEAIRQSPARFDLISNRRDANGLLRNPR